MEVLTCLDRFADPSLIPWRSWSGRHSSCVSGGSIAAVRVVRVLKSGNQCHVMRRGKCHFLHFAAALEPVEEG